MTDWNKLKVVDLKAELANRGLPQTGLKAALVARLVAADGEDGSESEATIQDDSKNDASSAASPDTIASTALPHSGFGTEVISQDEKQDTPINSQDDVQKDDQSLGVAPVDETKLPAESKEEDVPMVSPLSPLAQDKTTEPSLPNDPLEEPQPDHVSAPSALPDAESKAAVEDRLKRKRRSQSPPPVSEDVARKRFKTEATNEPQDEVITTDADAEWVEKHNAVNGQAVNVEAKEVQGVGDALPEPTIIDTSKEEVVVEHVSANLPQEQPTRMPDSPSKSREPRYNGLLFAQANATRGSPEPTEVEAERDVEPAIHPATSALYIKHLMRPLQASMLQAHLAMLATAPGHDTDPEVILNFYLDPIKTHAFVIFSSISAAARVRNAFHDRIWPDEKNRKQLWVDFVPSEKAEEWIAEETASNEPRSQKKWEVDYHVDEDRRVTATLQEANTLRPSQPTRQPNGPSTSTAVRGFNPPSGPRGSVHPPPRPADVTRLNELYDSTTTKPVLYFQPVSKDLANKRLDKIDSSLSKDAAAGRHVVGDIHRYTFEDGDQLVDRGPEIFSGIRPPNRGGYRGGRGSGPPYRDTYLRRDSRRDGGYDDRRADTYRASDRRDIRSDRRY